MNYLIRDIDPETWRRFKAIATLRGVPLRTLLLQFVSDYARDAANGLPVDPVALDRATAQLNAADSEVRS